MREEALAIRRTNHLLKQKEKQLELIKRIQNIEFAANPKDSAMDKVVEQVLPLLIQRMANEKTVVQQHLNTSSVSSTKYSDQEIDILIQNNPKLIKHAKKFTDEQIKTYIIEQDQNIDAESINKIIQKIRQ